MAEIDVQMHGGNIWFYDDFPCSGPAFNELSEQCFDAMSSRLVCEPDLSPR